MQLPNLEELITLRGAAHGLTLNARTQARALLLGNHRSAQRGRGLEFEEVRAYVAGDDPRSIDWRVTARRGRPHTKLFREERERPVWLLVDLHAGLFFGSRRQLKSMLAVRAAALLAWTAIAGGDRVGAVIAGANNIDKKNLDELNTRVLPPRSREAGALPLLNSLIDLQPRAPDAPQADNLNIALRLLAPLVHPGSLVLVLSDFSNMNIESESLLSRIAAHSQCNLFWLTDPLEAHALPAGRFRVGLPHRLAMVDGADTRAHWLQTWQEREARITALAQRFAMPLTRLDTAENVEERLRPLFQKHRPAA